jgi:hypothetical protein
MNGDVAGRYIHKKNRSQYIELKPDGNYVLFERGLASTGTYEVSGSDIRVLAADSTSQGTIRNGIIIDAEGEKWIRTDATDDPLPSMTWLPAVIRKPDFPWELVDIVVVVLIFLLISAT